MPASLCPPRATPLSSPPAIAAGGQMTFEALSMPLSEVTFVVVDLETTGGSAADCAITEIGAVKVRGGERLGEFQTLVNPGVAIPPFIAVLTGITDADVATAPSIEAVLPSFLEFAAGAVLVAHNAPFDVGFLRAACERLGLAWPKPQVVDTVRLARGALTRDEAPNCKLETLARLVRAETAPEHRALSDARATVDVLHALLERLSGFGVHDLDELVSFSTRVSSHQRRKRHLADGLPALPGVYLFADAAGRVLYVGKSGNLRTRVRSYFTAAETRRRMVEMIAVAETVTPIVCATPLEAEVRELRLIAEHKPPYNRRSRFPERATWVKLTAEAYPRLSLVRDVRDDGGSYLGPFGSRRSAEAAVAAIHEVHPVRQCTPRLSARSRVVACILAALGRCGAPCDGRQSREDYSSVVADVRGLFEGDCRVTVHRTVERMTRLSADERYEDAAVARDRLTALLRGAARREKSLPLLVAAEVAVARRADDGGWELHLMRHGRLVGSAMAPPPTDPRSTLAALRATAEPVEGSAHRLAALPEETECLLRWLDSPGVRLVEWPGGWPSAAHGAQSSLTKLASNGRPDVGAEEEGRS